MRSTRRGGEERPKEGEREAGASRRSRGKEMRTGASPRRSRRWPARCGMHATQRRALLARGRRRPCPWWAGPLAGWAFACGRKGKWFLLFFFLILSVIFVL